MRLGRVVWLVPALGVAVVVACGSSDARNGNRRPDPTGGAGGEDVPQGGQATGGDSGRGGRGGTDRGGTGGAGEAGDGQRGGTSGDTGTGGDAGTGADAGTGGDTGGTSGEGGSAAAGEGGSGTTIPTITLTISGSQDVHAISPRIYGINPGPAACSNADARFTLCRLGGNAWSTYNWENNKWTVPINVGIAQLMKIGPQPIQLQLGYRYYAERPNGGPDWGIRFTITFLFPK